MKTMISQTRKPTQSGITITSTIFRMGDVYDVHTILRFPSGNFLTETPVLGVSLEAAQSAVKYYMGSVP